MYICNKYNLSSQSLVKSEVFSFIILFTIFLAWSFFVFITIHFSYFFIIFFSLLFFLYFISFLNNFKHTGFQLFSFFRF